MLDALTVVEDASQLKRRKDAIELFRQSHLIDYLKLGLTSSIKMGAAHYKVATDVSCKKVLEASKLSTLITHLATFFPAAISNIEKKNFIPLRLLKLLIARILERVE